MTTKTRKIELVELQRIDGGNGSCTAAIIEHPTHGRLLILEGFGGVDSLHGGAYRWRHGVAFQVLPTDTILGLLDEIISDCDTAWTRMKAGYDDSRPVLELSGSAIQAMAKEAGL